MKTKRFKVHRNFKLNPKLNDMLVKLAAKERRTQTSLVETALERMFSLKDV